MSWVKGNDLVDLGPRRSVQFPFLSKKNPPNSDIFGLPLPHFLPYRVEPKNNANPPPSQNRADIHIAHS